MRTVVFSEPGRVELRDLPTPEIGPNDVLVETNVTSISPGTELTVLRGTLPLIKRGEVAYPLVPGYENCGQVVAIGAEVEQPAVDDWVFVEGNSQLRGIQSCWGGHSEYVCVPSSEAFRVPVGVTPEEATFTCVASIALHGIQRGRVGIGDSVVIFGQGAIGLLALQMARLAGATRVIAVDLLDQRLELSQSLGAAGTVNASWEEVTEQIMAQTDGEGGQVVIDVTGSPDAVLIAPRVCALRGRLVLLGMYSRPVSFNYWDLYTRELDVLASTGAGPKIQSTPAARWTWAYTYAYALQLISERRVCVDPLITHRLAIEDISMAYDVLQQTPEKAIKVMLQW